MARKKKRGKKVETLVHDEASRKNIPTAEHESVMAKDDQAPVHVAYARRNRDLDPQLVWRGKDEQGWSDLVVPSAPLFIQEKIHPKVLVDDLIRRSQRTGADAEAAEPGFQADLFADFNGLPSEEATTEFYQHDANWANRMILGDSLQVMASLAEREGLRGKVQCIYIDPPYGIKFNSNFQWSTTSRDVKDGKADHITREPEQVKAFRDTWRDGVHSYLTYLRDRITVARDLLNDSGSIFVQIGDENVHRVRALMDEVFGEANCCSTITFVKTSGFASTTLPNVCDYLLWYAKDRASVKFRGLFEQKEFGGKGASAYNLIETSDTKRRRLTREEKERSTAMPDGSKVYRQDNLTSPGWSDALSQPFQFQGRSFGLSKNLHWKTTPDGLSVLVKGNRISAVGNSLAYVRFLRDFAVIPRQNVWADTATGGFGDQKFYVVQTVAKVVERCVLMTTDPGDLVIDPTCGSGTTAHVAEQWGRRWITIDTSRVALALARARIMGARYPYYLLADSRDGQLRAAEITRSAPSDTPTSDDIRQGFLYKRVSRITLKSIANNAEIDAIWDEYQVTLEPLREKLNATLKTSWEEWEIPREANADWSEEVGRLHTEWWEHRIARQKEIDASIAAKADFEYLYDKPYVDKSKVRVAGPFTAESVSPHRALAFDENDELIDIAEQSQASSGEAQDFTTVILENLRTAGVQQAHKEDKIVFSTLTPWPGHLICAEGRYIEGSAESGTERRAAVFIGPEFGTVSRADLVQAAKEAGEADCDVLVACAFNYEAHATEFSKLGRIPVLKARMNADLHMADDLKTTSKGNLFVIFGEPDIEILDVSDDADEGQVQVKINGVDVFHPNTGEIRSDGAEGIACWFIDTDYNEESFFVRHAYFLGANDPYKALKTTLKAEINKEAWETLHSDISRPFDKPESGRIAVKVINHLGDEVMKVFRVD